MLAKLIKYEFKSTMKIFLSLYGVIAGFTLIQIIMKLMNFKFLFSDGILVGTYLLLTVAALALTFISGIQRFFKNILGAEGYLMNTLPVKSWQLVMSKLLVAVSWFFGSMLLVIASIAAQLAVRGLLSDFISNVRLLWESTLLQFGWNGYLVLGLFFLFVAIYACYGFLMVYCAMSLGHLLNTNRIIASFAAYMGLYFVVQMISAVVILLYGLIAGGGIAFLESSDSALSLISIQMSISAALCIIYYSITNYIVRKRLNLE